MIVHNIDPVFIDLGFFQLRWYSLSYIFGIILGWIYAKRIIKYISEKNKLYSVRTSDFDDLIIYLILGIILGGRLGYVLFYDYSYYIENITEIFKLWKGGMSFHGGLLGVIISTLVFSKQKNINFLNLTDIISCVAPIGIFLGRIANFINGELVGKVSDLPWAIIFPKTGNMARHPSQIYEAALEGVFLFVIINYFATKKKFLFKQGYISGLFLMLYSILRMFAEIFREPDQHLGYFFNYLSMGTILSIITLLAGFLIIFYSKNNEQNN